MTLTIMLTNLKVRRGLALPVLVLALMSPVLCSRTLEVKATAYADITAPRKQVRLEKTPCTRGVVKMNSGADLVGIRPFVSVRLIRVHTSLQGGGYNCRKCSGRNCAWEELCCPSPWTPTFTNPCCAQCCQGVFCGQEDCCFMP